MIEELIKNQVPVTAHNGNVHGLDLSQEGKVTLQRIITHDVKLGGRNLHDALQHLMDAPVYKNGSTGPEGRRALLVRNLVHAFKEMGELRLMKQYPDIKQAVKNLQREHADKMKSVRPLPSDEAIDASDLDLSIAGH